MGISTTNKIEKGWTKDLNILDIFLWSLQHTQKAREKFLKAKIDQNEFKNLTK